MTTWSALTVMVCAQIALALNTGKLPLKEPPLHENATLVAMVEHSNLCRSQYGFPAQRVSPYLTELAQTHANWMASSGRFQHNYNHNFPEIIYWSVADIPSAFAGWMNSGAHRSIILSGSTHVGYGYAVSSNGTPYWCGVFGNMRDEKPASTKGT